MYRYERGPGESIPGYHEKNLADRWRGFLVLTLQIMTKQDVIRQMGKRTRVDPEINRSIIDTFFEVVKSAVAQGETVYIRTFGSFGPKQRAAKVARNINQNTALPLEARRVPYFKPSPELLSQVRLLKVDAVARKPKSAKRQKLH